MGALLEWSFASGRAVDLVLLVFLLEAIWLVGSRRMRPRAALAALFPGIAIVLALRVTLAGGAWTVVALLLAAALPLHLLDLAQRGVLGRSGRGLSK